MRLLADETRSGGVAVEGHGVSEIPGIRVVRRLVVADRLTAGGDHRGGRGAVALPTIEGEFAILAEFNRLVQDHRADVDRALAVVDEAQHDEAAVPAGPFWDPPDGIGVRVVLGDAVDRRLVVDTAVEAAARRRVLTGPAERGPAIAGLLLLGGAFLRLLIRLESEGVETIGTFLRGAGVGVFFLGVVAFGSLLVGVRRCVLLVGVAAGRGVAEGLESQACIPVGVRGVVDVDGGETTTVGRHPSLRSAAGSVERGLDIVEAGPGVVAAGAVHGETIVADVPGVKPGTRIGGAFPEGERARLQSAAVGYLVLRVGRAAILCGDRGVPDQPRQEHDDGDDAGDQPAVGHVLAHVSTFL